MVRIYLESPRSKHIYDRGYVSGTLGNVDMLIGKICNSIRRNECPLGGESLRRKNDCKLTHRMLLLLQSNARRERKESETRR